VRRGVLMLVVEATDPMEREVVDLMTENGGRELEEVFDPSEPHPYVSDSEVRWHEPPNE
jgi:hypothetical protein